MINILTAILNENINYKLKEYEKINIKYDDIQYEEGLIEIIENDSNIDILILNSIFYKNIISKKLMKLINKETIIILIKLKEEVYEYKDNVIQIENRNEDEIINEIINIISNKFEVEINKVSSINYLKEENEKIKNELEMLKKIIEQKKEKKLFEKIKGFKKSKEIKEGNIDKKSIKKGNIILFTGVPKTGKTVISSVVAENLSKDNKVLLIDLNFKDKDLITLFNKKKFNEKEDENILIKINDNLDLLSDLDIVIKDCRTDISSKLDILLNQLLYKYDYLIIDFNLENENFIFEYILNKADKIFILIEGDLLNLKESKKAFEKITNVINKKTIQIIINKNNSRFIEKEVIENILNVKISMLIDYSNKFIKFINTNGKTCFRNRNIENLVNKIIN